MSHARVPNESSQAELQVSSFQIEYSSLIMDWLTMNWFNSVRLYPYFRSSWKLLHGFLLGLSEPNAPITILSFGPLGMIKYSSSTKLFLGLKLENPGTRPTSIAVPKSMPYFPLKTDQKESKKTLSATPSRLQLKKKEEEKLGCLFSFNGEIQTAFDFGNLGTCSKIQNSISYIPGISLSVCFSHSSFHNAFKLPTCHNFSFSLLLDLSFSFPLRAI